MMFKGEMHIQTASDLRAEIARGWSGPLYKLAAACDVNPATFSAILHERLPMRPTIAWKVLRAITRQQSRGQHAR